MKFSNLLFALVVASLITFTSCTVEEVDPRVGTWHSEVEVTPLGDVYVEIVYSSSNAMTTNVKSHPSGITLGGTTASTVKEINSTTHLYEITSAVALGQTVTEDEPFYKASMEVDGDEMELTTYESDSVSSVAEAIMVTDVELTLERQ
jgi:hypothetical protein